MACLAFSGQISKINKGEIQLKFNKRDLDQIKRFYNKIHFRERKSGRNPHLEIKISIPSQVRTLKQLKTCWLLLSIFFEIQNGHKPSPGQKETLHNDFINAYGFTKLNPFNNRLRAVRFSEANVGQMASYINTIIMLIASEINLLDNTEGFYHDELTSEVRALVTRWMSWRGSQALDPLPYSTEKEFRELNKISEASLIGGLLFLHHMITRGAAPHLVHEPQNWLMLTLEEHNFIHQHGDEEFLALYPHLRGKFERIRKINSKF